MDLIDDTQRKSVTEGFTDWIKSKLEHNPGAVEGFNEHFASAASYVIPRVMTLIPKDKFGTPLVKWKRPSDAIWDDKLVEQVTDKLEDYFIDQYGPANAKSYARNQSLMTTLGFEIITKIANEVESLREGQGIEDQLEEASPEALAKIDELAK